MPNEAEYDAIFSQAVWTIFEMPFTTKAQARHIIALANQATIRKRKELTDQVTEAWKVGFATLKAENDRAQGERDEWYKSENLRVSSELAAALVQCSREFQ